MATQGATYMETTRGNPVDGQRGIDLLFYAYIILMAAGNSPLSDENVQTFAMSSESNSLVNAIWLILSFVFICKALLNGVYFKLARKMLLLLAIFAYCALTLSWSISFMNGFGRLVQLMVLCSAVAAYTSLNSPHVALKRLYTALLLLSLINTFAALFVPGGVHSSAYAAENLVGAWKGIQLHKNVTGATYALTWILGFIVGPKRKIIKYPINLILIYSLYMTESKTSLALVPASIILFYVVKNAFNYFPLRVIQTISLTLALIVCVFLAMNDTVINLLEDRTLLTGRGELWQVLITYIKAHPYTGSGFGSFWRVGFESPIIRLTDGWGSKTGQGHNGYLDLAVNLGLPGALLVLLLSVAVPFYSIFRPGYSAAKTAGGCIWFFFVLQNLTESTFLAGTSIVFLSYVYVCNCVWDRGDEEIEDTNVA